MPGNLAATAAEEFVLSLLCQGRKTKSLPVKQAVSGLPRVGRTRHQFP
jgi:hypothetical protein